MEAQNEYKIYLERTDTNEKNKIKYPLYTNCYASALEAMWNNVHHNKQAADQNNSQGLLSNIIAFVGVRGSGKTTALNEFNRILRNYNDYRAECGSELLPKDQFRKESGWFHVLKSIDASLLEKDEDMIELIWANMYKDFEKVNDSRSYCRESWDEAAKSLIGKFDKVYKNYTQSKEKHEPLGETVLAKLKNLASSLKTKETCDTLIEEFLKYIRLETGDISEKSFLVVTVDDLDLNMESGYRILENLYRYLNNPHVIVLIAIDYAQMKAISDKHFVDALRIKAKGDNYINIEQAERLSSDFLMKVLPLSNRIYMPDNKNILGRTMIVDTDRHSFLKAFILGKIAEKMGIYYDAVGLKWHFCVPQTLRELVQYNDFLKTLYDLDEMGHSEEEKISLYDVNHERFNRDIGENMTFRILNLEQQKLFKLILERNIERRAGYAVNFLNNRIKDDTLPEERQKISDSVDEQNYCYGNLLQAIYKLGREDYKEKALIHCVLASFTSEMTKEYYNYIHEQDMTVRNTSARRLESFLGSTFGGEWFKNMGPQVVDNKAGNDKPVMLQCVDQGDIDKFCYKDKIKIDTRHRMIQIEDIFYLVPILECVFTLFPNYYDGNKNMSVPKWKIEFNGEGGDKFHSVEINVLNKKADFDIWGFVGKEIVIGGKSKLQEQSDKIVETLLKGYIDYREKKGCKITKDQKRKWKTQLLAKSIGKNSVKNKIYFPFYNLDLTYNIIKRVRRKINKTEIIDKSEILTYLQKTYGYIAYELQREDLFYEEVRNSIEEKGNGNIKERIASHFMDDFVLHPFIRAIGCQVRDQNQGELCLGNENINKEKFNNFLYEILKEFRKDETALNNLADAG